MQTREKMERHPKRLFSLNECLEVLGEPLQTLPQFMINHPRIYYERQTSLNCKFYGGDVINFIERRDSTPNFDPLSERYDKHHECQVNPYQLLTDLEEKQIVWDKKHPNVYLCFISDGKYIKILPCKDINKELSAFRTGNPQKMDVLFVLPFHSYDHTPTALRDVGFSRNTTSDMRAIINGLYFPFHVKNSWYDLLGRVDIERYKREFASNPKDEKLLSAKKVLIQPETRKHVFPSKNEDLSPEHLDQLLLSCNVPLAKNTIGSYVYFISDGQYVKIGFATNVSSRLQTLCSDTYKDLEVLFTIPIEKTKRGISQTTGLAESILHGLYAPYHVSGEWYDLLGLIDFNKFKGYYGSLLVPGNDSMEEYSKIIANRS